MIAYERALRQLQTESDPRPDTMEENQDHLVEDDEDNGEDDSENDSEDNDKDEERLPTPIYTVIRPNQFKMPDFFMFQQMNAADRKAIYKKSRKIQTRQLHMIAALHQQLNEQRNAIALLKSDNESTYELRVDTPYDMCEFPREIGDGFGAEERRREDCDWVVLSRSKMLFDARIVLITPHKPPATVDPCLGTESGHSPLPLTVTLCDNLGNKIDDPFLAPDVSAESTANELTFNMATNAKRVTVMIRVTSRFLKLKEIGDGKVRLKFSTTFKDKHLTFETRPFHVARRISAGKVAAEAWKQEVLHAVCDECACCTKRLDTVRHITQDSS